MAKITYTDKVDSVANPAAAINKVVAADLNEIKTSVNLLYDAAPPYKVYTALLSQLGTAAPVATVLENTLGVIPVWQYDLIGAYFISDSLFTVDKTWVQIQSVLDPNGVIRVACGTDIGLVYILGSINDLVSDSLLLNTAIEIRVYN